MATEGFNTSRNRFIQSCFESVFEEANPNSLSSGDDVIINCGYISVTWRVKLFCCAPTVVLDYFEEQIRSTSKGSQYLDELLRKSISSPTEKFLHMVIHMYTTDLNYAELNQYVRRDLKRCSNLHDYDIVSNPFFNYFGALTIALEKEPIYKGKSWRKLQMDKKSVEWVTKQDVLTLHGFTSSTTRKEVALKWEGNLLLEMQGSTGRDVSKYSEYPNEQEILFSPFRQFKVLSVEHVEENLVVVVCKEGDPLSYENDLSVIERSLISSVSRKTRYQTYLKFKSGKENLFPFSDVPIKPKPPLERKS